MGVSGAVKPARRKQDQDDSNDLADGKGFVQKVAEGHLASYIPDDSDPLGVAVAETIRHGPFFLLLRDVWTCVTMFSLFPGVITPLWSDNPRDEFYCGSWRNVVGLGLLGFVSVLHVLLVVAVLPLFTFLPGPVSVIIFVLGKILIHLLCYPIQGPSRVQSKTPTDPEKLAQQQSFSHERWLFLNGCCVSGYNLQQNVDQLADTFGRPVLGIHNRTYGVLGDLFECIIQRSFNFTTEETRVCYEYLKAYLTAPDVKKVVLIAHSQGCIMASQILDQLYVDIPAEAVSKMEVYTFGNAAGHFNNPLRHVSNASASIDCRDVSDGLVVPPTERSKQKISQVVPERVVPHIEHYCNSKDMVTRWGALFSAKIILQNRFCGHIFIIDGQSGHMLNQHYLSKMFPLPKPETNGDVDDSAESSSIPFLDRIVISDSKSGDANSKQNEEDVDLQLGDGEKFVGKNLIAEGSRISVIQKHDAKPAVAQGPAETVRQLSRLWRYLDGADPDSRH